MENIKIKKSLESEFEGKTVEDAVKKAVVALNAERKDLDVRVVSEGHKGLFGMEGAKPVRIIATIAKERKAKKKT